MSPTRPRFRYDVFLSYSHHNREWVRDWLVPQLQQAGLTVCIDYASLTPGAPSITEIERTVLQSRKIVCILTPEYLQSGWTEFENLLVQTPDPAARQQRLIPLLLSPCAPPLRLTMLTHIDFTRAEEQFGNVERLITEIRRRSRARRSRPDMTTVNIPFEAPTGALSLDSPLYIERRHDHVVRRQVTRAGSTTLIEGARQMGKTSLMVRALAHARAQQCTIVDFNFQTLDEQHFDTLETLLRYLVDAMHERLQLAVPRQETWRGPLGAKDKCTAFINQHILPGARLPVVVAVDEADRVFARPFRDDFFALLRAWHDLRASNALWRRLNLLLSYSTDPRQAIQNLDQSPFNVGTRIQLDDFSRDEAWKLNRLYQRPLKRQGHIEALMDVIGGHPYLLQQALYVLATRTASLPNLLNTDGADNGPFADHLQHYWRILAAEPSLRQGMQQAITNGTCTDYGVFLHLRALGLVTGASHRTVSPRCRLYATYFQRVLS